MILLVNRSALVVLYWPDPSMASSSSAIMVREKTREGFRLIYSPPPFSSIARASVQQERRDLRTPFTARDEKRCPAKIILLVNRSAASVQQEGRGLYMPEAARAEKRCLVKTILLVNRSAASVQQERRDLHMPALTRYEEVSGHHHLRSQSAPQHRGTTCTAPRHLLLPQATQPR